MNKIQELKEKIYKNIPYTFVYHEEMVDGHLKQSIKHHTECDIHLEHVLMAIGDEPTNFFYYSTDEIRMDFLGENDKKIEIWYNLTKTFDQNCENPELVDFLLEVIK